MIGMVLWCALIVVLLIPGILMWRGVGMRDMNAAVRRRAAGGFAIAYVFGAFACLLAAAAAQQRGHAVTEVIAAVLAVLMGGLAVSCFRRAMQT